MNAITARFALFIAGFAVFSGMGTAHSATFAYIPNNGSNNVSVIDTATNAVFATVAVGANPIGSAVNSQGTFAYVANE